MSRGGCLPNPLHVTWSYVITREPPYSPEVRVGRGGGGARANCMVAMDDDDDDEEDGMTGVLTVKSIIWTHVDCHLSSSSVTPCRPSVINPSPEPHPISVCGLPD